MLKSTSSRNKSSSKQHGIKTKLSHSNYQKRPNGLKKLKKQTQRSLSTSTTNTPTPTRSNPRQSKELQRRVLPVMVTNSLTGALEPLTIRHSSQYIMKPQTGSSDSTNNLIQNTPNTPQLPLYTSPHLNPGFDNALTWYVCGPTVYDASHIGHARTYTNFDMMRRILHHYHNIPLLFAMGVTDIDDKIINRAKEKNVSWLSLARHWENEFNNDLQSLHILPPDMSLRVSEFIPDIISYINQLQDRGLTYSTSDGVYFDVQSFSKKGHLYGKLRYSTLEDAAKQVQTALTSLDASLFDEDASQPKAGSPENPPSGHNNDDNNDINNNTTNTDINNTATNVQNNNQNNPPSSPLPIGHAEKRHPADFCLWKYQKTSFEPSFESPFGTGRPGWHIECSAMTASSLGIGLDIHSGGVDLRFPHHCNEIAQAEGCLGWGEDHLKAFSRDSNEGKNENDNSNGANNNNDDNNNNNTDGAQNNTNNANSQSNTTAPSPHFTDQVAKATTRNVNPLGADWTTTWIHTGHLNIKGLKMSKSLKNFVTIKQLFTDGYNADDFRMLCATAPYGSTLDYTPVRLQQARGEVNNVKNFKELIKRTFTLVKADQINSYNNVIKTHQLELDHSGNIMVKGIDGQYVMEDEEKGKGEQEQSTLVKKQFKKFKTIAEIDFLHFTSIDPSNSTDSPVDKLLSEAVYLDNNQYIRPYGSEYQLQQHLVTTQNNINTYLSTDFNTQQTINSLSLLISATTKYVVDKQQVLQQYQQQKLQNNNNTSSNQQPPTPPSTHLLTQVSTYVSKIYNVLGFQFAGAYGGSWGSLGGQIPFVSTTMMMSDTNTSSNQSQSASPSPSDVVNKAQDGTPVFLHQLAMERYLLKQTAIEGAKTQKKVNKSLKSPPTSSETVTIDKALLEQLIEQLGKQNNAILGACDAVRDQIFDEAGYVLKDTASAAGTTGPSSSYYIGKKE